MMSIGVSVENSLHSQLLMKRPIKIQMVAVLLGELNIKNNVYLAIKFHLRYLNESSHPVPHPLIILAKA